VAALAMSLLAVAFLLGRASVPTDHRAGAPVQRPTHPRGASAPPPRPVAASPQLKVPAEVEGEEVPAARPTAETALRPADAPPAAGQPEVAAAARVAAYFAQVKRVQGSGGLPQDQAGVQRMLVAMLQGDTSDFDRLMVATGTAEREVKAIQAPPECQAYHALLVSLLAESRALLADLRAATVGQDTTGLASMAARAASLQAKAEELKTLERELRRTYGLPVQ
jgi:hypothetical protein